MSLTCAVCGDSLGRSDTLPGREGVLVHPVIMGMAYVPTPKSSEQKYEPAYLPSDANVALCFECIEEKLPADRKVLLQRVYSAYETEMLYKEQKREEVGQLYRGGEGPRWFETFDKYMEARKLIPKECLFTGKPVKDGNPFFVCQVIDRVNSDLGSHFFAVHEGNRYGNYQTLGRIEHSGTGFRVSFGAMRDNFPFVFKELSCQLRGVPNTEHNEAHSSEIYVTPEFKQALEKETGKTMAQLLPDGFSILPDLRNREKQKLK